MCGRYTVFTQSDDSLMLRFLAQAGFPADTSDIYPTNAAPVLIPAESGKIRSRCAFWGFDSPFEAGKQIINSRSESAAGKRFFFDALNNRRCVIPATDFYEWSRGENKQKFIFTPSSGGDILYMAGAYNQYGPNRQFVIFTRDADTDVSDIHNRMPVLMRENTVRDYLLTPMFYEEVFVCAPPPLMRRLS